MGRNGSILSITNDTVRFLFSLIIIFSLILLLVSLYTLQSVTTISPSEQLHVVRTGRLRKANYTRSIGFLDSIKAKKKSAKHKQLVLTSDKKSLFNQSLVISPDNQQLVKNEKPKKYSVTVTKGNSSLNWTRSDRRYAKRTASQSGYSNTERRFEHQRKGPMLSIDNTEPICKMPNLKPFDQDIQHLFIEPSPLECKGQTISYMKDNHIFINSAALKRGKYETCQVSTIERDSDLVSFITDPIDVLVPNGNRKDDVQIKFKTNSDFLIFGCENLDEITEDQLDNSVWGYETDFQNTHVDIHAHINPIQKVIKHALSTVLPKEALGLSVIMLGIDSTSRLNFIRKMPKSLRYITEVLGSVVMKGYNIVGDATNGAVSPMLTGKHEKELPEVRKSFSNSTYVDAYPFIWKDFKKAGYATLFVEDSPDIAAFNWRLNGFNVQPTDHYMRTFWQEVNIEGLCLGPKSVHEIMLDYIHDYMYDYKRISQFGFMLYTGLTHSDINQLSLMDDAFLSFLKTSYEGGLLNNTLLIVFSDHGARYTKIRATLQGKLEERLPFMSIYVPNWIRKKHPKIYKNLKMNSDRLTTPFDIHATLQSVLSYSRRATGKIERGMSLFDEVPLDRTCEMANIVPHWCACLQWEMVTPGNNVEVDNVAESIIDEINSLVAPFYEYCAHIMLKKVMLAQRLVPNEKILKFDKTKDVDQREAAFLEEANVDIHEVAVIYQVTVETVPGPGLFEATLKISHDHNNKTRYEVMEEISRINRYGDQPKCIADKYPQVAKFCFCKNQLNAGRDE